ncbi:LIM domain-containing protein ajuba [Denticeps clupeoides]|uniref:LIM zinc-binding domain-containing protein n=1 Tax=Denticeps clupeoides TaxID=299321 RepID=A0AAY4A611_9TELE|nr:LIM domain-containing protein ajuba [Denticeps clupeoides]
MDRLGTKLLTKLKLADSGSVKFSSSKKKSDQANANNNSNGGGPVTGGATPLATGATSSEVGTQTSSRGSGDEGTPARSSSSPTAALGSPGAPDCGPSALAPLRRRSPQQRASCYLSEGLGDGRALGQRRYSLELQQLVRRQQLLAQPPPSVPPAYSSHSSGPRCAAPAPEPGFLAEPERHKRLSLQEALFYKRLSSGGEPWDSGRPASLSHPPPRAPEGAGVGGGYLFGPGGPALSPCSSYSLQESVLASPRSSIASSTASGGGGGGGSPMSSRCSSNRTSGISLGFDTRHTAGPGPLLQFSATQLSGTNGGQCYPPPGPGKAGSPHMEMWRDYLESGVVSIATAQDSRHSYPPAVGTEPWGDQRACRAEAAGERARHSDLPGTRYQQELTRLLLRDAALEREELLDGLTLREQAPPPGPSPSGGPGKPPDEPAATRDSSENRQEFFGTCVKCGKGVYGAENACQALDGLYHTRCFTCVSCGRTLRNKDFYNVSGSVYCKEDYLFSGFQAAAQKCSVCGHLILEQILQALGNSYHPGCFRCTVCSKALDGVPFTVDYLNNVYCVADYNRTFAPKCAACLQPILPAEGSEEILRVVSMNKDYHFECYHCEKCGMQLSDKPGSQCFPLDSHLLCHTCHMARACAAHNLAPHTAH